MPFSLFECRDGTFVVVPRGLAPPLPAYQAHGESIHLSDLCRHLYDTSVWDDVSREVERQLYAVVHPDVAFHLFDLPAGAAGTTPGDTAGEVVGGEGEQRGASNRMREHRPGPQRMGRPQSPRGETGQRRHLRAVRPAPTGSQ